MIIKNNNNSNLTTLSSTLCCYKTVFDQYTPELSKTLSKGRASDKSIIFWSWILRLECCSGSCFETVYQRWKCIDLLVLTSNNTRIKKRAAVINCQRRSLSSQKITVCRMIQSEINSLHRQRHRNKLFVPSKFHHTLQKILIRLLSEVSHYCTSENSQCHSQGCEGCV